MAISRPIPAVKPQPPAVKRVLPIKQPLGKKPALPPTPVKQYFIPDTKTEPINDLGVYSFLIYGQKKIGKTTLASLFEDALFFMFEAGAKALRIRRVDCDTWDDARGYLSALEKAPLKPKTAVLDTGFELHQKCFRWVCDKLVIDYPREENYGKDWDKIKQELRSFHNRITALKTGLVVLCHESLKEQQTFTGQKYDQVVPLLAKASDEYYRASIDNVWWYHYRGKQRFLQIRGTDHAMAGTALQADQYFRTENGDQIYAIPIPDEPTQGMEVILRAFNNQQARSYKSETEQFSEKAIKVSMAEKIRLDSRKRHK